MLKRLVIPVVCLLLLAVHLPILRAATSSAYERSLVGVLNRSTAQRTTWTSTATVLGALEKENRVIISGRNEVASWYFVESQFGYGYVNAAALSVKGDIHHLPVVSGDLPNVLLPDDSPTDDPAKYPILPTISAYTRQIYERGLQFGNRPEIFTKVGDCMTADALLFMGEIGEKHYDLGVYTDLQDVIDYYSAVSPRKGSKNSFVAPSAASFTGFNASSVEDPEWLPAGICPDGVTPLACEYAAVKPGVALIMFGTNDMTTLTPSQYDFYLRLVVIDTLDRGIIPLLSTFPGDPWQPKKANRLNQIVYKVARDFDVPVMNLWLAIQSLPNAGLRPQSNYLSQPSNVRVAYFKGEPLQYGYTMRNLVTLQALDIIWKQVIQQSTF